ncbi:hypothetical protein [Streptomyces sp. RerS4]|uniref:hypothetical protein n=1 Tax=Streptomyces sp. RerS4 TaxID=2942449 RepID=UPI00201BCDE7|nr:hypothetical protein [Streptomyces sp. RerS4]UQX00917.1 hypothetical protein M4D82_10530 [Streptomyces sp. RerS4]
MGGREHTRDGRRRPSARPVAPATTVLLLLAFTVVACASFLCARPAGPAVRAGDHPLAHAAPHTAHAGCVSPYDHPGCRGVAHVTPAVLPAPPPAVTVADRTGPAPVARTAGAGAVRPPGTLARAPDLHTLQVLRT